MRDERQPFVNERRAKMRTDEKEASAKSNESAKIDGKKKKKKKIEIFEIERRRQIERRWEEQASRFTRQARRECHVMCWSLTRAHFSSAALCIVRDARLVLVGSRRSHTSRRRRFDPFRLRCLALLLLSEHTLRSTAFASEERGGQTSTC